MKKSSLPSRRQPLARSKKPIRKTWIKRSVRAIRKVNPVAKAKRDKRYKAHLSSAYWKALRVKVWARMEYADRMVGDDAKLCECGCEQIIEGISEMQLAHLTYARFGHELDSDVQGQTKYCNQTEAAMRGKRITRKTA